MAFQDKETPRKGEIWLVDFSPSIGSEIKEQHPALIVSVDELNESSWGLIVVCPITTFRKEKPFRLHVLMSPPEGGIKHESIIRCDQIKSVSIQRFSKKWGSVDENTMRKVDYILRKILNL
ncbi:MAG: type II toxin-antitoxin system PemK/MazF family toxin [Nitrospirota bacterium]